MPLNLSCIEHRVRTLSRDLARHQLDLKQTVSAALALLHQHGSNPAGLSEHINWIRGVAAQAGFNFVCAAPTQEQVDLAYPLPSCPERVTIIASDGSQILPDPHAIILYYIINVSCIIYRQGSGKAPEIYNDEPVLCCRPEEVLDLRGDVISPAEIKAQRDLGELVVLAHLGQRYVEEDESVIVLTDGPLRLRVADLPFPRQEQGQKQYRALLDTLKNAGIITAGYIDRPRSYYKLSMLYTISSF